LSKRKCRLEPTVSFVAEPRAAIKTREPATARRYAKRPRDFPLAVVEAKAAYLTAAESFRI
jgi:hypothetical protein